MKVKDIVREDGQMPQMGKVTAQQPGVAGAPGMVTVTMSNGIKQMVPSNMISAGPDGKPMIDTQQQTGQQPTTPPTGTTGQPPVTMGQDVKVQEEPNTMDPANNTNTYYVNYDQMAAKVGNKYVKIMPSKMWFDLTPDVAARANAQGFSTIYLSIDGNNIPGVMGGDQYLGSRIDIAPREFQKLQMRGTRNLPGRMDNQGRAVDSTGKPYPPAQKLPGKLGPTPSNVQNYEESAEVSRIKMLSGLK